MLDNYHNSFPTSLERVSKIALDALPADASEEDKEATKIDVIKGDLRDKQTVDAAFAKYADKSEEEKIWAVILVAALKAVGESGEIPIE